VIENYGAEHFRNIFPDKDTFKIDLMCARSLTICAVVQHCVVDHDANGGLGYHCCHFSSISILTH